MSTSGGSFNVGGESQPSVRLVRVLLGVISLIFF